MNKRTMIVVSALCSLLAACDPGVRPTIAAKDTGVEPETDEAYDPSAPGGIGMTYTGKIGFDLGGGLVLGSDGKVGVGFGF